MAEASIFLDDEPVPARDPKRRPADESLPVFVIVMMIFELIGSALRIMGVVGGLLALAGVFVAGPKVPAWQQLIGVAVSLVVVGTALPAAIGVLSKRSWAVPLGWVAAIIAGLATLYAATLSISMFDALDALPAQGVPPEMMRMIIVVATVATYLYLLVYLVLYCLAIHKYGGWLQAHRQDAA